MYTIALTGRAQDSATMARTKADKVERKIRESEKAERRQVHILMGLDSCTRNFKTKGKTRQLPNKRVKPTRTSGGFAVCEAFRLR